MTAHAQSHTLIAHIMWFCNLKLSWGGWKYSKVDQGPWKWGGAHIGNACPGATEINVGMAVCLEVYGITGWQNSMWHAITPHTVVMWGLRWTPPKSRVMILRIMALRAESPREQCMEVFVILWCRGSKSCLCRLPISHSCHPCKKKKKKKKYYQQIQSENISKHFQIWHICYLG